MAEVEESRDGRNSVNEDNGMSYKDNKLQLPMSCDPPGPNNPPKRLVWIVSYTNLLLFIQDLFTKCDNTFSFNQFSMATKSYTSAQHLQYIALI